MKAALTIDIAEPEGLYLAKLLLYWGPKVGINCDLKLKIICQYLSWSKLGFDLMTWGVKE